jgi:PTS system galactitol-specific IIA component
MLQINEFTVLLNTAAPDCHAVINLLADALHGQGFVSADYGRLTCVREAHHPTGLPTRPFCIAFPHADSEGVIQSALGVAILKDPVKFKNMADPTEDLEVHIVIMLANANPEEQIQSLRNLATLFGQDEKLEALRAQATPQDAVVWLRRELCLEDEPLP